MRAGQHARWQGLDPSTMIDPTTGLLDPNMQLALARAGQGGLLLPQAGVCLCHNKMLLHACYVLFGILHRLDTTKLCPDKALGNRQGFM
jgi:hypothetical protein